MFEFFCVIGIVAGFFGLAYAFIEMEANTILKTLMFVWCPLAIIYGIYQIAQSIERDNVAREAWVTECEHRGGIVLDRTYTTGKTTSHQYSCVKKDAVIE